MITEALSFSIHCLNVRRVGYHNQKGDKLPHLLFPVWLPSYICPPNGVGGWAKKLLQPKKFDPLNIVRNNKYHREFRDSKIESKRSPISNKEIPSDFTCLIKKPVAIKLYYTQKVSLKQSVKATSLLIPCLLDQWFQPNHFNRNTWQETGNP